MGPYEKIAKVSIIDYDDFIRNFSCYVDKATKKNNTIFHKVFEKHIKYDVITSILSNKDFHKSLKRKNNDGVSSLDIFVKKFYETDKNKILSILKLLEGIYDFETLILTYNIFTEYFFEYILRRLDNINNRIYDLYYINHKQFTVLKSFIDVDYELAIISKNKLKNDKKFISELLQNNPSLAVKYIDRFPLSSQKKIISDYCVPNKVQIRNLKVLGDILHWNLDEDDKAMISYLILSLNTFL